MRHFAVSAVGRDRPGIVAEVTRVLLAHTVNVEDSRMALLRGQFMMMLIVSAPDGMDTDGLAAGLDSVRDSLELEMISLNPVDERAEAAAEEATHVVTVYGADHPGIVHAVSSALAEREVNIVDLATRLVDDDSLYVLMIEASVPAALSSDELQDALAVVAEEQGVDVTARPIELDAL